MSSVTKNLKGQSSPARGGLRSTTLARDRIHAITELAIEIQRQLASLNQVPTPAVEHGLDFYDEVSRFEIALIKEALKLAEGHQTKAAQLLNLKATTLNVMIKRYNIPIEQLQQIT